MAKAEAQTAEMAWFDARRVARQGDLVLVLGLEQVGPVLRDVGDDLGVDLERHDAVVVAVPLAVGVLGGRPGSCPRSRPCTAGSRPSVTPCGPNARPTSTTSGACGPGLSLLALMASSSSFEPPPGLSPLIGMPYLAVKPSMSGSRSCTSRAAARSCSGRLRPWPRRSGRPCRPRRPKPLPTRRPMPGSRQPAADPAAVGAAELPADEHAANTKLATTRRPAIRVTLLVGRQHPSSSCLRGFPDSKTVGGLLPRDERSAHPPPVWRTAARAAWSSRALDSPLGRASRGWPRIVNGVSPDEHRSRA